MLLNIFSNSIAVVRMATVITITANIAPVNMHPNIVPEGEMANVMYLIKKKSKN